MKKTELALVLFLLLGGALVREASAGGVVVASDEWAWSDAGFAACPGACQYALNVAQNFAGGPGTFHVYSTNPNFVGSSFCECLEGAGHTCSTGDDITFDLPTLASFDGIFMDGEPAPSAEQAATLTDYVRAGGSVYVAGGYSFTNPGGVATAWNVFLNQFGLSFASSNDLSGIVGCLDVTGCSHPIFESVSSLHYRGGQSVSGIGVVCEQDGLGLYAVACPLQALLGATLPGGLPRGLGAGLAPNASALEIMYRVRDEKLARTAEGRAWISLYYEHAPETTWILVRDADVRRRALELTERTLPVLRAALDDEAATLPVEDVVAVDRLLGEIGLRGSEGLRSAIRSLRAELRRGELLASFGIAMDGADTARSLGVAPQPGHSNR